MEHFHEPAIGCNVASNSTSEANIKREASFTDLPPEMIERILNYVSEYDLFNCRQVNRRWKQISSGIMRGLNYNIHFGLIDGKYVQQTEHQCCQDCSLCFCKLVPTSGSKSLTDLVVCLEKSSLFPFTCFTFVEMSMESFIGMSHFLQIWGDHIRILLLTLSGSKEMVEILLTLLLEKVPNLKKLGFMHDPQVSSVIPSSIPLLAPSNQLQLSKMEHFWVHDPSRICGTVIENILTASPKLKGFSMMRSVVLAEDLKMLNRSNKLHCLNVLSISITEDLIAYWKGSQNRFELQLRSLTLSFDDIVYRDHQLNASASEIISQLFHSSRNSIETLVTEPLAPLTGLVFPKFKQLGQLRLRHDLRHNDYMMFPLSFDWTDKFPKIKELDIEHFNGDHNALFNHSLKSLPSIESLRVSWNRNNQVFGELIKRTSNVKTLMIDRDFSFVSTEVSHQNQHINFEQIATYLPKLKNLSWRIHVSKTLRCTLDALITGLPEKYCKKLAGKFRNKDHLLADKASSHWKQCSSSILELKELENLHLLFDKCPHCRKDEEDNSDGGNISPNKDDAGFDPDSIFYETGLSKVSKFLGFDRKPDLNVVIHKIG